jgi:hypothetical protein
MNTVIGILPSHSHCNVFAMHMYTYLNAMYMYFNVLIYLHFFTLYNDSLPNILYHYILFFPFPLIRSNFHTMYPYFSRSYITPHSTFHIVTSCVEHSGAQVYIFSKWRNVSIKSQKKIMHFVEILKWL